MKKQVKIILGLMLCAALIMTLVGCGDPTAASGGSGNTDGATNAFAGKTYGVRIDGGARYYGFTETVLKITEQTNKVAAQNRMQSDVAQQVATDIFVQYEGPYTTDGDTVSWESMDKKPITANFDFKEDGSFSVETKTDSIVTETAISSQNVNETVTVPDIPTSMVTKNDLRGFWHYTDDIDDYMGFTDDKILFHNIIGKILFETYEEPYIAQFGKAEDGSLNEKAAWIRILVDQETLEEYGQEDFDTFITFNENKDEFTIEWEDETSSETYTTTYKKITEAQLPPASTYMAKQSDLYGTWKNINKHKNSGLNDKKIIMTEETILTFSANKVEKQTTVLESDFTGDKNRYPYFVKGYTNARIDIIQYDVSGAHIQAIYNDYQYNSFFIDKDTFYDYGNIKYTKTTTEDYTIGDRGPGGGYVFKYNNQRYEISGELGEHVNDGKLTWQEAKEVTTWNGSNDWHLPTIDELRAAYSQLVPNYIPAANTYWSSTKENNSQVWIHDFSSGGWYTYHYDIYTPMPELTPSFHVRVVKIF